QDSLVYPESGLGIAVVFAEASDGGDNLGTIWIDEISIYTSAEEIVIAENNSPVNEENQAETAPNNQGNQGGLPFCGNMPFAMMLIAFVWVGQKRKQIPN
ncbi:MAG: hypothetical protein ABFS17_10305, partial [Chloroflexota bacterium]